MIVGTWSGTVKEWNALSASDRAFFQSQQAQPQQAQSQQAQPQQGTDSFDVIIAKALASAIETSRTVRMVTAMSSLF